MPLGELSTLLKVIIGFTAVAGFIWGIIKALHRYYERFLFFSSCHLLPLSLRNDIIASKPELKQQLEDHAFAPIIVLPARLAGYFKLNDGDRVKLSFKSVKGSEMHVTAFAYWYPEDPELWGLFDQPALSLVLRRYFGIERPILGEEDDIPEDWHKVTHGTHRNGQQELAILHRTAESNGNLIWLSHNNYSTRFWLPDQSSNGAKYSSQWQDGGFLEYAGISLKVSRPSILTTHH